MHRHYSLPEESLPEIFHGSMIQIPRGTMRKNNSDSLRPRISSLWQMQTYQAKAARKVYASTGLVYLLGPYGGLYLRFPRGGYRHDFISAENLTLGKKIPFGDLRSWLNCSKPNFRMSQFQPLLKSLHTGMWEPQHKEYVRGSLRGWGFEQRVWFMPLYQSYKNVDMNLDLVGTLVLDPTNLRHINPSYEGIKGLMSRFPNVQRVLFAPETTCLYDNEHDLIRAFVSHVGRITGLRKKPRKLTPILQSKNGVDFEERYPLWRQRELGITALNLNSLAHYLCWE